MKRPQFSLRTSLIATALVAVPVAWFASEQRESSRQHAVAVKLEVAGASVDFDGGFMPRVTGVHLNGQCDLNEALPLIAQFPELVELTLQSGEFSNEQLRHLTCLQKLETVDLKWTTVSDEGLEYLAQIPSIRSLKLNKSYPPQPVANLSESQITDRGLSHLANLKQLETLIIWGADISDAGLRSLSSCPNLKVLWLCDTNIGDEGLVHLRELRQLKQLDLCGTNVTAASLEPLQEMPSLGSLSVARTRVSNQDALKFQTSRPRTFSFGY